MKALGSGIGKGPCEAENKAFSMVLRNSSEMS